MSFTVRVTYMYGPGRTRTMGTFRVQGKSESAIVSHLRRMHKTDAIEIVDYTWL